MLARFLQPAAPTLRSAPPRGEQWLHEVKFDGWRIQLHKHGSSAAAYTKNGHGHSSRVRWMVNALARLQRRPLPRYRRRSSWHPIFTT
jgi:bifunctional non-homologous end joining protein LigD